jgi:hypothetical protein
MACLFLTIGGEHTLFERLRREYTLRDLLPDLWHQSVCGISAVAKSAVDSMFARCAVAAVCGSSLSVWQVCTVLTCSGISVQCRHWHWCCRNCLPLVNMWYVFTYWCVPADMPQQTNDRANATAR